MIINNRYIMKKCTNSDVFYRGNRIYQTLGVEGLSMLKTDENSVTVYSSIKGSFGKNYDIEVDIDFSDEDNGKVTHMSCGCLAFERYNGACKHIAATLLEFGESVEKSSMCDYDIGRIFLCQYDEYSDEIKDNYFFNTYEERTIYERIIQRINERNQRKTNIMREIESSSELKNLMEYYTIQERNRFCLEHANGDVRLEMILNLGVDYLACEFRIGRNQMYVVKNIWELAQNIKDNKYYSYGKNLAFTHTQSSFSKESLPLVEILMSAVNDNDLLYRNRNYYSIEADKRYMKVSPKSLDMIMRNYEDKDGLMLMIDGNRVPVMVSSQNPSIYVNIKSNDEDSHAVINMTRIIMYAGINSDYIYLNNTFYICQDDFKRDMNGILKLISGEEEKKNLRNSSYYSSYYHGNSASKGLSEGEYSLILAKKDFQVFSETILPIMQKYMKIDFHNVDFDNYDKIDPVFRIYLDIDNNNNIICTADVLYSDKKHNINEIAKENETYRNIKEEFMVRTLIESYFERDNDDKQYRLNDDEARMLEFIENGVDELKKYADVYASDAFSKIKIIPAPIVTTGVSISGDLLEVSWDIGMMKLNELEAILSDYRKKKKYHRLKNGDFLRIDNSGIGALADISEGISLTKKQLSEGHAQVPLYRSLYLDSIMKENSDKLKTKRDNEFKRVIREMKSSEDSDYEIPSIVDATLRGYQEVGYQWISTLAHFGFGGILADDMGLGKTLQMITFLAANRNETSIVICPASLVYNWMNEFARFAGEMRTIAIIGNVEERTKLIEEYRDYDVVITSYDLLKRDIELYSQLKFCYQVIDEAQYIKNQSTQVAKAVKSINSKCRFALTGTPIENRLSELWSIFEYLMPGYLFSYSKFRDEFEKKIVQSENKDSMKMLHKMIKPFILRRLKKDVLKELPDKMEEVIYAKMSNEQEKIYKANEKEIVMKLSGQSEEDYSSSKLEILAAITKLRQICCDPQLIYDNYKEDSAKVMTCIEVIESAISGGHRILLFSQFTTMLDKLNRLLIAKGISTLLLTGKTSKLARNDMVNRFQNGNADVFLISLKAGGTGLNLTKADIVIHYDPWWNVAAQNQATDRAHRIGQKNEVTVIKLIMKDTIEERILNLQEKKKKLADEIISEEGITIADFSKEQLLDIFVK